MRKVRLLGPYFDGSYRRRGEIVEVADDAQSALFEEIKAPPPPPPKVTQKSPAQLQADAQALKGSKPLDKK